MILFFKPLFNMACQLGKGIYGRFVFSMFWAKDIVLLQEAYQSVVHHPLKQLANAAC